MSDATTTPRESAAETNALVRDFVAQQESPTMPEQHDPIAIALEARDTAMKAVEKADEAIVVARGADGKSDDALRISNNTNNRVMGLAVVQESLKRSLDEHRAKSEDRHVEVINAIEGAKTAVAAREKIDTIHGEEIKVLTASVSKLNGTDVAKGSAAVVAVGALLLALARMIDAFVPVAPSLVQARWGTPVVVTVAASSTAPVSPLLPASKGTP